MQGFKSAKEIWDVLKTTHERDEVTKITKREMTEGELETTAWVLQDATRRMY